MPTEDNNRGEVGAGVSDKDQMSKGEMSRRNFLRFGTIAAAGVSLADTSRISADATKELEGLEEVTIAQLQERMANGSLTALGLVNFYLSRIARLDKAGPKITSVIEVNPDARDIARQLDAERQSSGARGPLHGIPILLKDNIDTADKMQSAAGSFALVGSPATQDATVAARLRKAGAIILGKANLSEWANFRSFHSSSGWSGRGGQCKNPFAPARNPCGSSSGSAAAVSANFSAVSLGTETDGSIVCPSSLCGIVGIKPTVGLTSRAGVVPISHTQDTVGPHARTVADAATVLGALVGVDSRDPATSKSEGKFHRDYTQFLDPDGLRGARIGVVRNTGFFGYSEETDAIAAAAIEAMGNAGATIVDPVNIPTGEQILSDPAELIVLVYEFPIDLQNYLSSRTGVPIRNLQDAIAFNLDHRSQEMPFFLQEIFDLCAAGVFSQSDYRDALKRSRQISRGQGVDATLRQNNLNCLVAPTGSPAWPTDLVNGDHFTGASSSPCAMAGYPIIQVPAGYSFGLPVGMSFMGTAFSEPTLIKIASGFEAVTHHRRAPNFATTLKVEHEKGAAQRDRGYRTTAELMRILRDGRSRHVHPFAGRL
jgi:amidase